MSVTLYDLVECPHKEFGCPYGGSYKVRASLFATGDCACEWEDAMHWEPEEESDDQSQAPAASGGVHGDGTTEPADRVAQR